MIHKDGKDTAVEPVIQLTRQGTVFRGSADDLDALRATFREQHWIRLPRLVGPDLLARVRADLASVEFKEYGHANIGKELVADRGTALLTFVANDPALFEIIEQITGRQGIQCFTGRVYRMNPASDHYDSWHDDLGGHRLIAMSLNLAAEPFEGGILQIRDRASKHILQEVANTTYGDAIIFNLLPELQHRVTPVAGTTPRTAFAGWFRSEPSFREMLWGEQAR